MTHRMPITRLNTLYRHSRHLQMAALSCACILAIGFFAAGIADGAGTPAADPLPATWIPEPGYAIKSKVDHGQIKVVTYDNTVLGKTGKDGRKASVYLPPGYSTDAKYPVLYALHGIGGDHKEWLSSKPQEILDNLLAAHKIVPMIVVFPNGRAMNPDKCPADMYGKANVQGFNDLWDKDMKDFLIPYIDHNFSVQPDKDHRAIMGYSMGGMQALRFGLDNPKYFGWIGALSPAFRPDPNLLNAADVNGQFKHIFLSAGTRDSLFNPAESFSKALTAKGIHNIFVPVQDGKHDGSTWSPGLYNFAQIIFK